MNSPSYTMNMGDFGAQSFSITRGNINYASTWSRLKDIAMQTISKENEIALQLRQMERLAAELEVYGGPKFENKVASMMSTLASNPSELAKELSNLALEPTEKLKDFNKYYYSIQKSLYDCLSMSMLVLYTEDDYLFQVMIKLQDIARNKKIYLAPKFVDEIQNHLIRLLDAQIKELLADQVDFSREEAAKRIRKPFLMRLLGDGYVSGYSRNQVLKWRKNGVFGTQTISDQIANDLTFGKVDSVTLSMIVKQMEIMLSADREIRHLAHATVVLLDITRLMAAEVAKNLNKFHSLFGREPGVETMYSWLNKMEEWGTRHSRLIMDRQRENTASLLTRTKKLRSSLPSNFSYLKQLTRPRM